MSNANEDDFGSLSFGHEIDLNGQSEAVDDGNAKLYEAGTEHFSLIINELLDDPQIQQAMSEIEEAGFVYAEEYGYVLEPGTISNPGAQGHAVLAMIPDNGSLDRVVYIATFIGGPLRIDAVELYFGEYQPDEDFDFLEDGAWIRDYPFMTMAKSIVTKTAWSWKRWFKCTIGTTVAVTLGGAVRCAISGPAYGQCVAGAAAGGLVTGVVGCTIDQAFD